MSVNRKQIGLLFGSFNPIHLGHLIIAETVANYAHIDQVWLVVSPQNPLKEKKTLLNQYDRLHLVQLAIENNPRLVASDIEFMLPKPSYTINTLTYLQEKYPNYAFWVIIGEDNMEHFHKWKNYEAILKYYNLLVFPRVNHEPVLYTELPNVQRLKVPMIEISSTYIRELLRQKKSIRYLVPEKVHDAIMDSGWWR
ncbi:MAG TPA: nicotinate (nicotinamide) nucleotide adenylyltransferase [Chitinophagales bacterium]|nr:nicotinate (nicotinamide) nucleotide adenylyltransferase [Chitinophagales bacterium]HRK25879.1 nicotinate (nicotinamide) nucleotide adenylyltransferase [Chitinophagales bacterium]